MRRVGGARTYRAGHAGWQLGLAMLASSWGETCDRPRGKACERGKQDLLGNLEQAVLLGQVLG